MRRVLAVVALALAAQMAFAGAFFVNFVVLDADKAQVEDCLASLPNSTIAVYDKSHPRSYMVYEEAAEGQDLDYGMAFATTLAKALGKPVLYTLVHDSDVLVMMLVQDGKVGFSYNSWPGYFEGEEQLPQASGVESLAALFKVDMKRLLAALNQKADAEVFAEEALERIRKLLGLSEAVFLGYDYARSAKEELERNGFEYRSWN
jgi:hypothetical protein